MKFSKLLILAAFALVSTAAFGQQKFGVISAQEIMYSMPETDSMQIKLKEVEAGLINDMNAIQNEYIQKQQDYQKNMTTYTTTMREQKEREIQSLRERIAEFEQVAQLEMQEQQQIMMRPVQEKLMAAIKKVSAAEGFAMVFDKSSAYYVSETLVTDITDMVIKELGITRKPLPTALQQPQQ